MLTCQQNTTQEDMASKINATEMHIHTLERCNTLLQSLQMPRHLEYLSCLSDEHLLNTAKWLVDGGRTCLSISALREMIHVGWAVYHYPVLDLVKFRWEKAKVVLPAAADRSYKEVDEKETPLANVVGAQT